MSRELLKRVLMARTIGYPLPPSLVKDIEAELAKPEPEPVARLAWFRKYERDTAELVISDASQGDSFPVYTHPPAQQKPLSEELAKPEPEPDYRRVLKEINEFIKADILPEEIKAELAKPEPEPEPIAWKTTDIFGRALFTDSNAVYKRWIYEGMACESLYTHPPAQQKPLNEELAKPEPELDYRRVLKEINEFIKADILPEEIKAELAKPEPVAWKTTDIFGRALFTDSNAVYKRWIYEGMECESLYTHPPTRSNLYEALKCLVEQTRDGMGCEYDDGEWPALDKAREALAKAKGDS